MLAQPPQCRCPQECIRGGMGVPHLTAGLWVLPALSGMGGILAHWCWDGVYLLHLSAPKLAPPPTPGTPPGWGRLPRMSPRSSQRQRGANSRTAVPPAPVLCPMMPPQHPHQLRSPGPISSQKRGGIRRETPIGHLSLTDAHPPVDIVPAALALLLDTLLQKVDAQLEAEILLLEVIEVLGERAVPVSHGRCSMGGASWHPSHGAAGDTARGPCLPAAPATVPAAAPFLFFFTSQSYLRNRWSRDGGDGRVVKPEPRRPLRASARRAARGSAAHGGGLSPLSLPHHCLPDILLLPSAPPGDPACILQAPSGAGLLLAVPWGGPGTPWSHLLKVSEGLRLDEGTHLQVLEEARLHQGARLGLSTWGAMGPPQVS